MVELQMPPLKEQSLEELMESLKKTEALLKTINLELSKRVKKEEVIYFSDL